MHLVSIASSFQARLQLFRKICSYTKPDYLTTTNHDDRRLVQVMSGSGRGGGGRFGGGSRSGLMKNISSQSLTSAGSQGLGGRLSRENSRLGKLARGGSGITSSATLT